MLTFNFNPFPVLHTQRLVLRQLSPNDAEDLFVIRSDKNVMRYINRPIATTVDDALELINKSNELIVKNEGINWAVTFAGEDKLIGIVGYWRTQRENYRSEIGYILHAAYHQKGIMHEAVERVVEFGFNEMQLHSIEANIDPENTASVKLIEKNKFVKEAHFKENCYWEGKFLDSAIYSRIKS